ncbi:MAG TPA: hypothetical protein VMD30_08375, partial [Tepidisphaeraceae bacterium]|nr:hypothetical protein [Tepidisphaeraceae bacterium]
QPVGGNPANHGLQDVDGTCTFSTPTQALPSSQTNPTTWYDNAYSYLYNPGVTPPGTSSQTNGVTVVTGTYVNYGGAPQRADSYILISAGPDRCYGTADDITNFGSVR